LSLHINSYPYCLWHNLCDCQSSTMHKKNQARISPSVLDFFCYNVCVNLESQSRRKQTINTQSRVSQWRWITSTSTLLAIYFVMTSYYHSIWELCMLWQKDKGKCDWGTLWFFAIWLLSWTNITYLNEKYYSIHITNCQLNNKANDQFIKLSVIIA